MHPYWASSAGGAPSRAASGCPATPHLGGGSAVGDEPKPSQPPSPRFRDRGGTETGRDRGGKQIAWAEARIGKAPPLPPRIACSRRIKKPEYCSMSSKVFVRAPLIPLAHLTPLPPHPSTPEFSNGMGPQSRLPSLPSIPASRGGAERGVKWSRGMCSVARGCRKYEHFFIIIRGRLILGPRGT